MPEIEVTFHPADQDPRLLHLSLRTPDGYLEAEVGDPKLISDAFGKTSNPARWKLLRSFKGPISWIFEMKVSKGARGRGIGSDLLSAALDILREEGVRYAVLSPRPETMDDWERLILFYKKFGFEEVRKWKGEDLWSMLMVKDLSK